MKSNIIILIMCVMSQLCFSEKLNVFTDYTSEIYLNRTLIGENNVTNYDIEPGYYFLEVMVNNTSVFSEIIEIKNGENEVVTVLKDQVNVIGNVPEESVAKRQANYVVQKKSKVGFGFHLDYPGIQGLKFSYDMDQLTHQLVFWLYNSDSYENTSLNYRIVKYIGNNFEEKSNLIIRTYYGFGLTYANEVNDDGNTKMNLIECPFGFEFRFINRESKAIETNFSIEKILFWPYFIGSEVLSFLADRNLYYYIETGLVAYRETSSENNESQDYTGLKFALGATYYF